MGKFKNAVMKDLDRAIEDIEGDIRKVLVNAVEVAQMVIKDDDRIITGYLVNNWYFTRVKPTGPELENKGQSFLPKTSLTLRNVSKWKFGDNAFIVNNTNYASYHDLGTVYITPLFISFQVEAYVEKEVRKIR